MSTGARTLSIEETLLEPQALPPPPTFHHSPAQVLAAIGMTESEAAPSFFAGSPGTM